MAEFFSALSVECGSSLSVMRKRRRDWKLLALVVKSWLAAKRTVEMLGGFAAGAVRVLNAESSERVSEYAVYQD